MPAPAFLPAAAVGVVLASAGYPDEPELGEAITGLDAADALAGVHVDHAATALDGGAVVTAGGRVLTVVGSATTSRRPAPPRTRGSALRFPGSQHRTDIAEGIA